MSDLTSTDPRAKNLSPDGLTELQVYTEWLADSGLNDCEATFVTFAVGRAGLNDARHLYAVWESAYSGQDLPIQSKLQVMRFFLNPTQSDFKNEDAAGWFEFLPTVYDLASTTRPLTITKPVFLKVGFTD